MSLLSAGLECARPQCRTQDFLPIQCPRCTKSYCRDHAPIGEHECEATEATSRATENWTARSKCGFMRCEKPSLDSAGEGGALCNDCGGGFCASHRDPVAHGCARTASSEANRRELDKNAKAKELLAAAFAQSSSSRTLQVSNRQGASSKSNPKKKAVELMRMRHRAVPLERQYEVKGATLPPLDQRRFIKVTVEGQTGEKEVWSTLESSVGRAVDGIVRVMGLQVRGGQQIAMRRDGQELDLSTSMGSATEDADWVELVLS